MSLPCSTNIKPLILVDYARKHQYRVRNLHDGYPVTPARRDKNQKPLSIGYIGAADRWMAIVGRQGCVHFEDSGMVGIYLSYKSGKGVRIAAKTILSLGGQVQQEGDFEVGAILPPTGLENALNLIKVSKTAIRNPRGHSESLIAPVSERDVERISG